MDLLIEIFIGFFIEGLLTAADSPKIPLWIRLILLFVLFGGFAALFIYFGFDFKEYVPAAVIAGILALACIAGWIVCSVLAVRAEKKPGAAKRNSRRK